jgi:hypothetical protein
MQASGTQFENFASSGEAELLDRCGRNSGLPLLFSQRLAYKGPVFIQQRDCALERDVHKLSPGDFFRSIEYFRMGLPEGCNKNFYSPSLENELPRPLSCCEFTI